MNCQSKSFSNNAQRGNAMVYVLIIVALFGALSFTLARQTDTSEAGLMSKEELEINIAVLQQSTAQMKQSIEQMTWTGTSAAALDFTLPTDGTFNDPVITDKLFHPSGGGAAMPRLAEDVKQEDALVGTPPAGWYIDRNIDVEWTPSTNDDVIMTAYQISQQVCAEINEKLTNDSTIPDLVGISATDTILLNSAGTIQFTSVHCPGCFGRPSLCVRDTSTATDNWSFYSILAAE